MGFLIVNLLRPLKSYSVKCCNSATKVQLQNMLWPKKGDGKEKIIHKKEKLRTSSSFQYHPEIGHDPTEVSEVALLQNHCN